MAWSGRKQLVRFPAWHSGKQPLGGEPRSAALQPERTSVLHEGRAPVLMRTTHAIDAATDSADLAPLPSVDQDPGEEARQRVVAMEREHVRDVLVRADHDHAARLAIHPP